MKGGHADGTSRVGNSFWVRAVLAATPKATGNTEQYVIMSETTLAGQSSGDGVLDNKELHEMHQRVMSMGPYKIVRIYRFHARTPGIVHLIHIMASCWIYLVARMRNSDPEYSVRSTKGWKSHCCALLCIAVCALERQQHIQCTVVACSSPFLHIDPVCQVLQ